MSGDGDNEMDWGLEIPDNPVAQIELIERKEFLDKLISGQRPLHAGLSLGWSPDKIRRVSSEPDMAEMLRVIDDYNDESVEMALLKTAKAGNFSAQQFWLMNRKPHLWQDVRKVQVTKTEQVSVEVVHSVKAAALELLREQGAAALQPGGALDVIDAEVVEDGDAES